MVDCALLVVPDGCCLPAPGPAVLHIVGALLAYAAMPSLLLVTPQKNLGTGLSRANALAADKESQVRVLLKRLWLHL